MFISREEKDLKFLEFSLFLHSIPSLQKTVANDILVELGKLFGHCFMPFVNSQLQEELKFRRCSQEILGAVEVVIGQIEQPFKVLKSHKTGQALQFEQEFAYEEPERFIVGYEIVDKITKDGDSTVSDKDKVPRNASFISVKNSLKSLLEVPGIWTEILEYQEKLSAEFKSRHVISNVMQGQLWKQLELLYEGKTVLPLILFVDDFDPLNELGSHGGAQQLTGTYISCPFLPPHLANRKENVFLNTIFLAKYRKMFDSTFKKFFQKTID